MLKKLILLVAIFLMAYLAAHFWIRHKNRSMRLDSVKASQLVDCEPNEVRSLSIQQIPNHLGSFLQFKRIDSPAAGVPAATQLAWAEWDQLSPQEGEGDAMLLNRLATMVCEIYDPVKDDGKFVPLRALDTFASELNFMVVKEVDVRRYKIEFGGVDNNRMVQIRFSEVLGVDDLKKRGVFRIPAKIFQLTSLAPAKFVNLKVLRMSSDNAQTAELFIRDKAVLRMERAGADWAISSGGRPVGKGGEEAQKYVNRLGTLMALEAENRLFSPAQCAEMKHDVRIDIVGVADRRETLKIDSSGKGALLACNTARRGRFRVHRDLLQYVKVDAKKLVR